MYKMRKTSRKYLSEQNDDHPSVINIAGSLGDVRSKTNVNKETVSWDTCCHMSNYRNDLKFSDRQVWANSADPDQTAPRGAV